MEKLQAISGILLSGIILFLFGKAYLKLKKDRKLINVKLTANIEQTADLRIWSQSYSSVVVNFGKDFDYCKFCFTDNEVFLLLRYAYPKDFYNGPFVLKTNNLNQYSYFSKFKINHFTLVGTEMSIGFGHQRLIGSSYKLNIKEVSESDALLLRKHLT